MSNVSLIDGHIDEPKKAFKVGDYVFGGDWCYGIITDITENIATVEFETGNGGGSIGFELSELSPAFSPKKQTNYDRIRNMSVEEMAEFITDIQEAPCHCCNYRSNGRSSGKCGGGYDLITCRKGVIEMLESEVTDKDV